MAAPLSLPPGSGRRRHLRLPVVRGAGYIRMVYGSAPLHFPSRVESKARCTPKTPGLDSRAVGSTRGTVIRRLRQRREKGGRSNKSSSFCILCPLPISMIPSRKEKRFAKTARWCRTTVIQSLDMISRSLVVLILLCAMALRSHQMRTSSTQKFRS